MNKKFIALFILLFILLQPLISSSLLLDSFSSSPLITKQKHPFNILYNYLNQPQSPSFIQHLNVFVQDTLDAPLSPFNPVSISTSDDAYHGSDQSYGVEWWYFDAILNKHYSLQFTIHVYTIFNTGLVTTQCHIFENGTKIIEENMIYPLSSVLLSTEKPFISINDNIIMEKNNQTKENNWLYQIKHAQGNYSFNLTFQGITQGWKGTTSAGGWTVALPKAIINGTLTLQNKTEPVTGIGYHDHNWNVSVTTGLNFGWLWGKTVTTNHTITWANIFKTWYQKSPLLVVNKDHNGFINIPSEHIDFSITKIDFRNGMIIPFGFQISAQTPEFELFLSIEVLETDFSTVFGLINYWRYHIHTTGTIQINKHSTTVDNYDIAEFMRFRPY